MPVSAPLLPHACPTVSRDGRTFSLHHEKAGWRLRSRSKRFPVDFRTGTHQLAEAKRRARDFLAREAAAPTGPRRGGGSLERLTEIYLATPKRTKANVARNNVSRLRTICRLALGRELIAVTCREVGPDLWSAYQRAAMTKSGHTFDLVTRHRVNIAINAAVRAARTLFLPPLVRAYRVAGLEVRADAGEAVTLPVPYVPPVAVPDADLVTAWAQLDHGPLWLTIGLARFAGLRREEIACARVGWLATRGAAVQIVLRDRPEENFWTKTGKPYVADVIRAELADYLAALLTTAAPDAFLVPDPPSGDARGRWFEREPQAWLRAHGITAQKPMHRLRGLYADDVATLTRDAVAARLAGIRAAQDALGHTTSATTERHYLTPNALR